MIAPLHSLLTNKLTALMKQSHIPIHIINCHKIQFLKKGTNIDDLLQIQEVTAHSVSCELQDSVLTEVACLQHPDVVITLVYSEN